MNISRNTISIRSDMHDNAPDIRIHSTSPGDAAGIKTCPAGKGSVPDDLSGVTIRPAGPNDAAALLAIYRPYVENTAITFEYDVPTEEEFRARIAHTITRYPYLIAEREGRPVGYAYAGPFKERAAYDWAVEVSIYVAQECRRSGIGRALYRALEEVLAEMGIQNLEACIAVPAVSFGSYGNSSTDSSETDNTPGTDTAFAAGIDDTPVAAAAAATGGDRKARITVPSISDEYLDRSSVDFHAHLGYRLVGGFDRCGCKFGRWYSMVWMEKHIGQHEDAAPIRPWPEVCSSRR